MIDPRLLERVHVFPVRHHSPRTSAVLAAFLDEVSPDLVLVEGPEDATAIIDVLVDAETKPPVAILGYRTDGIPGSSLWPFAAYSPEYVALAWAKKHGREAAFIDVPVGCALASQERAGAPEDIEESEDEGDTNAHAHAHAHAHEEGEDGDEDRETADGEGGLPFGFNVHEECARARGFRSFEEFWEASFEAPKYEQVAFRAALMGYADLVRAADRRPLHRARDAFMARKILARIGEGGIAPHKVAVIVGAAHAAAFAAGDVDLGSERVLPEPVASAVTLIPFSFPRLAEQLGYGAGNRAPQFYQRAHDAGCDYRRAALEVLVEFTEHLRLRGFMASLSDTIEAYRLALTLADIRGKAEPGLDEVREATIATMCRGDATHVDGFLWPSVIGRNIGRVADRIGKNSLQEEFAREVAARRLPATDAVESFVLKLNAPFQVGTSVFLHRLRVAGVSYASYLGKQVGGAGRTRKNVRVEEAGEIDALRRVSEAWEAQWTPSTEVALVEKIVLGDTLEQVVTRVLEERLAEVHVTGDAADVLLEAVVTGSVRTVSSALAACDRLASADDDLPSLAKASSVLSELVSYGSSRAQSLEGDRVIAPLCEKMFARAILRIEGACTVNDEGAAPAKEALRMLHRVALAQTRVDRQGWFTAMRALSASYAVNPSAAGLASGLLYLAQVVGDDEVGLLVGQRLSNTLDPAGAAGFLQGFFEVNALALVKSRPVVAALDAYLVGIDKDRFRDLLPVLRRAFAPLGPTERRYLLENVIGVRSIGEKSREATALLLEKDKDKLKAMNADLAKAMDDMDDLL